MNKQIEFSNIKLKLSSKYQEHPFFQRVRIIEDYHKDGSVYRAYEVHFYHPYLEKYYDIHAEFENDDIMLGFRERELNKETYLYTCKDINELLLYVDKVLEITSK